ncbi:MAG: N-acetylglucosamine kinase [Bacteroidetes bacterium]|nr:N-acetylglucosamine kinase [Bacteroidota bacterium]
MGVIKLIADSGSTKTDWCLLKEAKSTSQKRPQFFSSQGLSPYFVNEDQMAFIIANEVLPQIGRNNVNEIYFYGTGCKDKQNARWIKKVLQKIFENAVILIDHDLSGAAKSLCGHDKGIACILGTGSNSCYYNGSRILSNSPGLGYVLGDEGSGAYLGKKVIQHYLYDIFDADLRARFDAKFVTTSNEILSRVYKNPLPNRYLASFAIFLAENRGHYMIENIIEDGLNDFFFTHIIRYKESQKLPVHFTGSVAFGFRDVVSNLCNGYGLIEGNIFKSPMEGLVRYHEI